MLRRLALAASFTLLAACGMRGPVTTRVTIAPRDGAQTVTITAATEIDPYYAGPAMEARVNAIRDALVAGHDEWSPRFAAVPSDSERLIIDRQRGFVRRVEHSAVIDTDDLQRFFADSGISVTTTRGEGWTELAIYPGASIRATRVQRERVEKTLHVWCEDAARYFNAIDHLYAFMARHPQRAEPLFTMLLDDRERQRPTDEEEAALLDGVTDAMSRLIERLQTAEQDATTIDEEFGLVYNPFSAEIAVLTPHPLLSVEHFERHRDNIALIPHKGLLDAMAALEERWISPDPLALALHAGSDRDAKMPDGADLAARPRRSTPQVTAAEIEKVVTEQLRPATVYRVRW